MQRESGEKRDAERVERMERNGRASVVVDSGTNKSLPKTTTVPQKRRRLQWAER